MLDDGDDVVISKTHLRVVRVLFLAPQISLELEIEVSLTFGLTVRLQSLSIPLRRSSELIAHDSLDSSLHAITLNEVPGIRGLKILRNVIGNSF